MNNKNYKRHLTLLAALTLASCVNAQTQYQRSERATDQDSTNIFPLVGPSGMTEVRTKIVTTSTTYNAGQLRTAGRCGASNNSILTSAPTSLLCDSGTPSGVTLVNGVYGWSCTGTNGVAAQCSAVQRVVGVCGSSNGASTSTAPSNLCSAGTATTAILSGATYNWYCAGNYGSPATCSAALVPAKVNCAAYGAQELATSNYLGMDSYSWNGMLPGGAALTSPDIKVDDGWCWTTRQRGIQFTAPPGAILYVWDFWVYGSNYTAYWFK